MVNIGPLARCYTVPLTHDRELSTDCGLIKADPVNFAGEIAHDTFRSSSPYKATCSSENDAANIYCRQTFWT